MQNTIKASKQKMIRSWTGFEKERSEMEDAALRYKYADLALAKVCKKNNASIIGCTIQAEKGVFLFPEANEAGAALKRVKELNEALIDRGLDPNLVRSVWAVILDPSPKEAALCRSLLK